MLKKLSTFYRQSLRRKLLFGITVLLSAYSWVLFRFFKQRARFGAASNVVHFPPIDARSALISDLGWAIFITAKYVPWENVCRHQAYQAKVLCNYYSIDYQIFVGFKKSESNQIEGHAWTLANGLILTGFCNPDEYVVQQVFVNAAKEILLEKQ